MVWFGASHINFLKGDKKYFKQLLWRLNEKEKRIIEGIYAKCLAQNTMYIRWVEKDVDFIYLYDFQKWHFSYKYGFLLLYMWFKDFKEIVLLYALGEN